MYVLVSHEHRDHYNPEILTWKNLKNNIHYIFPCEMSSLDELSGLPNIVYLDRGESYEDDRLRVNAFGSTDMGVSYLVTAEGKTIFIGVTNLPKKRCGKLKLLIYRNCII